jgi:hypothetical protein
VRQGLRLLVKPGTFFNQLQWSSHHWIILFLFLAVAAAETHIGKSQAIFQIFSDSLAAKSGLSIEMATWLVIAMKLSATLLASFILATVTWFLGSLFGRRTSKRVLFRRLSVVFTVFLAAYTLQQLALKQSHIDYIIAGFYVWGVVLGYFAIREQFALTHIETMVIGLFALMMLVTSFHFANHVLEKAARQELMSLAKMPKAHRTSQKHLY